MGAVAGAATILTSRKSWASLPAPPPEPADCTPAPTHSPATRPFIQPLPIPPIAIPTTLNPAPTISADTANGEAARADHQDWNQFFPFVQYDITLQGGMHQFHPDIPSTYIWGYNGIYPGPTFLNVYGVPVVVRFHNNLPNPHSGFGTNTHTTHLHNGHTASESDGFAGDFWSPGFFKDHHYPNVYAGFNANPPIGDPLEAQHTYWYHDHRHSFTATNNYRGLNGMYLIYDSHDNGLGFPTSDGDSDQDDNLGLPGPYGLYDIPLNLTDKLFCADGQMFATAPDAAPAGDKFCVNGAIQPFFNVTQRKYRFRILNSGPARVWLLNLVDNNGNTVPFQVVATDGNLLPSPVTIPNAQDTAINQANGGGVPAGGSGAGLQIWVSSRFDVVFDFTNAAPGTSWFLTNAQAQFQSNSPDPNPAPGLPIGNVVMSFNITGPDPHGDPSNVPSVLTTLPNISTPLANLTGTRIWNFNLDVVGFPGDAPGKGAGEAIIDPTKKAVFNVNGLVFNPNRSDAQVQQGSAETWLIRNRFPGTGWSHPVHIHLEEGRVLDRRNFSADPHTGAVTVTNHFVPPLQSGRRDVYPIAPNDEILIFLQFRDWFGKYMIHCHNLGHEDGLMLVRWDVVSGPSSPSTSAINDQGNPNTGDTATGTQFFPTPAFPNATGLPAGVEPNSGARPNITPALTSLPDTFNLNAPGFGRLGKPGIRGSKKGVQA
ncbi:MAG TPA: multicopper oxidase family protein [Candidatus Angelobacter sp.]